jgi:hypothetical protein
MPHHLLLLRLCLAANALAALAFVLQAFVSWPGVHLGVSQVVRAISLPITLVQMLSRFLGGASVLSALVAALATALSWSAFKRSSQRPPFGYFIGWATLAVVLRLVQLLAGAEVPDEVVELLERCATTPALPVGFWFPAERSRASPTHSSERMGSPTLQTLQEPILLLPWVCFRGCWSVPRPRRRSRRACPTFSSPWRILGLLSKARGGFPNP